MGNIGDIWVELSLKGLGAFDSGMARVSQRMSEAARMGEAFAKAMNKQVLPSAAMQQVNQWAAAAKAQSSVRRDRARADATEAVAAATKTAAAARAAAAGHRVQVAAMSAVAARFGAYAAGLKASSAASRAAAAAATAGAAQWRAAGQQYKTVLDGITASARMANTVISQTSRSLSNVWGQSMRMVASTTRAASSSIASLGRAGASLAQSGMRVLGTAATTAAQMNHAAMRIINDDLAAVARAVHNVASIFRNLPALIVPGLGHIVSGFRSMFATIGGIARGAVGVITWPFRKMLGLVFSLRGAIVALGGAISTYGIGKYLIENTADAEQAQIAFTTMLGSEQKALQMLRDIRKLADTTPLELPEVRQGARSLVAYGFAASKTVETLRMLGDVAQGEQIPLQDLVNIYGKVFETGRISGVELLQFGRRHIRVVSELGAMYGKTPAEIRKMASEGKIGFKDLETAFKRLTSAGGPFEGMLAKMGSTLAGRWSTLHDSIRAISVELGTGLSPLFKKTIDIGIDLANRANEKLSIYRERIAAWVSTVSVKIEGMGNAISAAFDKSLPYVVELVKTAVSVKTAMSEITGELIGMVTSWVGGNEAIGSGVKGILRDVRFLADNWRALGPLGMAYLRNWAEAGARFATSFPAQLGANLGQIWSNLVPALTTFGEILKEVFLGAIKAAKREMPWYLGGGGAEDKTLFSRIKNLSGRLTNELKDAFDNTDDPADQSQQAIDRRARRAKMGQGALPGFDLKTMFGADIPEIGEAWKNISALREEWEKAHGGDDLADKIGKAMREAENALKVPLGDAMHDIAAMGGKGGKSKMDILDPVSYYNKMAQSVTPHQRRTESYQGNVLKELREIAVAVREKHQGGRPVPAALA